MALCPDMHVDAVGNRYVVFGEIGYVGGLQSGGWFVKPYNKATNQWQSIQIIEIAGLSVNYGICSSVLDLNRNLHAVFYLDGVFYQKVFNGTTRSWNSKEVLSLSPIGAASEPSIGARGVDELVVSWDSPNNADIYYSSTFIIQGVPIAEFTATPTTLHPGGAVQFTFTGSLGTLPSTFSWDFGDGSPASSEQDPSHVYTSAGTYTVSLTVTDADLETDTETKIDLISVVANQAPLASFTFTPASPAAGQTVQFTDTSSDGDGTVSSWAWDFGDGTDGSTLQNPAHAFAASGTFTVTLTVTDDDGATSAVSNPVSVTEIVNQAPVADFSFSPASPVASQGVQFADLSTDADGTIVGWQWNFGDGTANSTLQNPAHAFSSAGTYTVELTATDDDGATATTSKTITVAAPYMYVQDITMSYTKTSLYYNIYTTVTVYSWSGTPLSGVTVTITLKNPKGSTYTLSGVTGADGRVTLLKSCSKVKGTYTSTVTNLVKSGWIYDPSKNIMTSKSLVVS
nr:PKD domain-containing protein [Candidatus Sigynarchaeum springense]